MKLYHFLMLMMFVNLGVGIVSVSGLWDIGLSYYTLNGAIIAVMTTTMLGLVGAVSAGVFVSKWAPRAPDALIYALFGGVFWALWGNTSVFIYSIINNGKVVFPDAAAVLDTVFWGVMV